MRNAGRLAILLLTAGWGGVLYGACSRHERKDHANPTTSTVASTTSGFMSDGANICGNEFHDAQTTYPLIYLVLDRSGSMLDLDDGVTRYEKVRQATLDLVNSLGTLVRVGLTLFPAPAAAIGSECLAGEEVFPPTVNPGSNFDDALDTQPLGGTPVAATLENIRPLLLQHPQPRVVILATDGGPNCNNVECTEANCIPNIVGDCPLAGNCCEPPEGSWLNCLDRLPTLDAIEAIVDEGTPVYVVGIPGSEFFGNVLNQMALYGKVPVEGEAQYYYRVDDLDTLGEVFKGIAAELVSCEFDMSDPPETQDLTNVYFDGEVVPLDPENGWFWVDDNTVKLVGAACATLKDGQVAEVQIVSGCPTVTPQ
ncbi:MAG: VWA domain-containing protein [Polyangiaceae bacterium]|nr:VWA domain-containing protein [Polyangiaceae bacterium]